MCGIFGEIHRDPRSVSNERRVIDARNTLRHRGPDEAGLWIRPGVALAHQRLRVLDLNHGQQPIVSPDQRFAMAYNGEVYNFADLQHHYRDTAGLTFDTRCDTELVFRAINHEGAAAIDRFNGMFAIAHWDDTQRRLLLVRDRLGKKPLYWYADHQRLVFASELKAILAYLDRKFPIDPIALDQFFTRGYVLAPRTIFEGIHKLPAGCRLDLDAKSWAWHVTPYWDFQPRQTPERDADVLDELDELLTDAVRMRMVSDVPIGCLLSGGIDSSLITALASKVSGGGVRAFSMGFDDSPDHDELPYAKMVAERHKCRWRHRSSGGGDFMAMLDEASSYYDEPFGNFTMFSMRRLAQMAREELVVVLTGQGGDELAGGYAGRYNWAAEPRDRMQAHRYAPAVDDAVNYLRFSSFVGWRDGREAIYSESMRSVACGLHPMSDIGKFWNRHAHLGRINNLLYTDTRTNLPDYLICLEERMTMSVSLEARNPLLDYRVVDFLLSLPERFKLRDGRNKWALLELARRYVPAKAIDRPKKGFTPPLTRWLADNGPRIATHFRETLAPMRHIYSPGWVTYLERGAFEPATTMPGFYSLMLAAWSRHYGRYVASWPGETSRGATRSRTNISTSAANTPAAPQWHAVLRENDALATSQSRWFCQTLANLPANSDIEILGEDADWYAFLARGSAMCVVTSDTPTGTAALIVTGLDSLKIVRDGNALAPNRTVIWFAPFHVAQQQQAKDLITQLQSLGVQLKGCQALPVAPEQFVLVARGVVTSTAATAATAPAEASEPTAAPAEAKS